MGLISLYGSGTSSSCGYCHNGKLKDKKKSVSFGFEAKSLSLCEYEKLLNVGWRRSGTYLYKPNMQKSCCVPWPIRIHSSLHQQTKKQKKDLHRFFKAMNIANSNEGFAEINSSASSSCRIKTKLINTNTITNLNDCNETFHLYCKYQRIIHGDSPDELSFERFKAFLIDSPLHTKDDSEDREKGSFHQNYYLDNDKLIAVGVVDFLPHCISSVYFFYDPDFKRYSLGNVSALYEIYQCNQQPKPLYYYLGYLIEDCPKMRYKAEYQPAEILDMIHTRHWKPFDEMIQVIKDYPIKRQPENQLLEVADDDVMLPIMTEDNVITKVKLSKLSAIFNTGVFKEFVGLVGVDLASSLVIDLRG